MLVVGPFWDAREKVRVLACRWQGIGGCFTSKRVPGGAVRIEVRRGKFDFIDNTIAKRDHDCAFPMLRDAVVGSIDDP